MGPGSGGPLASGDPALVPEASGAVLGSEARSGGLCSAQGPPSGPPPSESPALPQGSEPVALARQAEGAGPRRLGSVTLQTVA